MAKSFHIKKGDIVKVISGDDKNKTGSVLSVLRKDNAVVVDGVNNCKKSVKNKDGSGENFKIIQKPIDISNVTKLSSADNVVKKVKVK